MTSDGIEPPLSDLESEVLPLHHGALGTGAQGHRRSRSVVVSTPDLESGNPGSNPGGSAVWQSKSFRHRELNPGLLGEGQVF